MIFNLGLRMAVMVLSASVKGLNAGFGLAVEPGFSMESTLSSSRIVLPAWSNKYDNRF